MACHGTSWYIMAPWLCHVRGSNGIAPVQRCPKPETSLFQASKIFQGTRHTKSKAGLNLQLSLIAFHLLPLEVYAWRNDAMRDAIWCNTMQLFTHIHSKVECKLMLYRLYLMIYDDLWLTCSILVQISWICLWSVRSWHQTYFRRIAAAAMTSG